MADFGFFGRGFWIDQPIAFNASQPRCGATEVRFEFASHPSRNLAGVDHSPPSGERVVKAQAQFGEQVEASRSLPVRRCDAQVAKSLRVPRHCVAGEQLFDPSLAIGRRPRHLRDGVTTRQKPDYLEVPRCGGILTSDKPLFQLLDAPNDPRPSPGVPISRLMAPNVESISRKPYETESAG